MKERKKIGKSILEKLLEFWQIMTMPKKFFKISDSLLISASLLNNNVKVTSL